VANAGRNPEEVTGLLRAWRSGSAEAGEALLRSIYRELKRIASAQLRRERPDHTLQTTALVHEAFMRLVEQRSVDWRDRAHFFGLAATTMRRVLVDHARARHARKRSAPEDAPTIALGERGGLDLEQLLDLDRALTELAKAHPRPARVVEMRWFAELEVEEVALCLGVSTPTVKRDWQFARAWLNAAIAGGRKLS
jgi:RNA polymerase sigma-70 factor, ECF subfamily